MPGSLEKDVLRLIPPVDELLAVSEIAALRGAHPHFPWTPFVREIIDDFRAGKLGQAEADRADVLGRLTSHTLRSFSALKTGGLRRVINATGVILHTNLGRAIAAREVSDAVAEALTHYVNLEVDLETGQRGGRADVLTKLICLATGAETAMVLNNNAAAVTIVVNSYSPPGRVLVSRGELVEIGGSFRLPDILSSAADEVVEVGTTNRTYVGDYEKHSGPGDILLKVHRSNYDIEGFTHDATLADMVAVAKKKKCHVVYDLGSGSLFDFAAIGIEGEERVADILRSGVDCITMSGDKLIGGVQAGIVVGREEFIKKLRMNPLRRAFRVDKLTIAALQALLRVYLFAERPDESIPVLAQAGGSLKTLNDRAQKILDAITGIGDYATRIVDDVAAIGGGSFAREDVPSVAVAIRCASERDAETLARRMRMAETPILCRIRGDELRLNFRSILAYEDEDVQRGLKQVLGNP